jgi:hypothetical protein
LVQSFLALFFVIKIPDEFADPGHLVQRVIRNAQFASSVLRAVLLSQLAFRVQVLHSLHLFWHHKVSSRIQTAFLYVATPFL